jgi:hypothetical protein
MLRDGRAGSRRGEDVTGGEVFPIAPGSRCHDYRGLHPRDYPPPTPLVIRISDLRHEQSVNY